MILPAKILLLILLLLSMLCCGREELSSRISFCDDYAEAGCLLVQPDFRNYTFAIPAAKAGSWFDLGYYMYFHVRQTPGIRVDFSSPLEERDALLLEKTLQCYFRLETATGKFYEGPLEGIRIDANHGGFWCFDYLGTMLIEYHKKYNNVTSLPQKSFFPISVQFRFESRVAGIKGRKMATIGLDWLIKNSKKK